MILADTSIWVHHLRYGEPQLSQALLDETIVIHDFVIGELASGNLESRTRILEMLDPLPRSVSADHHEVLTFLHQHRLFGIGITWIDAHLLASARLTGCRLWTLDRRLQRAAAQLHLAHRPVN